MDTEISHKRISDLRAWNEMKKTKRNGYICLELIDRERVRREIVIEDSEIGERMYLRVCVCVCDGVGGRELGEREREGEWERPISLQ